MNFISIKFEFGEIIYRFSLNILLEKFIFYVDWDHGLDFTLNKRLESCMRGIWTTIMPDILVLKESNIILGSGLACNTPSRSTDWISWIRADSSKLE